MPKIPKPDKLKMVTLTRFALKHDGEAFAVSDIAYFNRVENNITRIYLTSGNTVEIQKSMEQLTAILLDLGWEFQDL